MFQPENDQPPVTCPLCGGDNHCAGAKGSAAKSGCWCTDTVISREALARVPEAQRNYTCICPRCASGDAE